MSQPIIRIEVENPTTETVAERIYQLLQCLDLASEGLVACYLNMEGHANLTVCPLCRVDDFTHVAGCRHIPQIRTEER